MLLFSWNVLRYPRETQRRCVARIRYVGIVWFREVIVSINHPNNNHMLWRWTQVAQGLNHFKDRQIIVQLHCPTVSRSVHDASASIPVYMNLTDKHSLSDLLRLTTATIRDTYAILLVIPDPLKATRARPAQFRTSGWKERNECEVSHSFSPLFTLVSPHYIALSHWFFSAFSSYVAAALHTCREDSKSMIF